MEMRLGHCLTVVFHEWIWIFSLTSILSGAKAEVRCIPSCQLPLGAASPGKLSALDLDHFGEAPEEQEFAGYNEEFPGAEPTAVGDGQHDAAEFSESEESYFKVQPWSRGNETSVGENEASNEPQKLFHTGGLPDASLHPNQTQKRSDQANVEQIINGEDEDGTSWRRTRRGAETWPGYRPGGEDEVSFLEPEEFQLTSSTFALSGDTAHNQAMVHWSGQNSSVSFGALHIYAQRPIDAVWLMGTDGHRAAWSLSGR